VLWNSRRNGPRNPNRLQPTPPCCGFGVLRSNYDSTPPAQRNLYCNRGTAKF
jgi:hypothetical protein